MSDSYDVELFVTVRVTVDDPSAIRRCVDNLDVDDMATERPDERGSNGWRNVFYSLRTVDQVLENWAWNRLNNGVSDVARLDGWADLPEDAVHVWVTDVDLTDATQVAGAA